MKKLIVPFFTILFASCAFTSNYYQVYKTKTENGTLTNDKIIFEDKSCIVAYHLWADGGDIGFSIYNKTESDLTVDLTKTFFVLNGVAYEYFQNRTFSKSSSSGTALTTNNYPYYYYTNYNTSKSYTASSSASYMEKPQLTIPPKTQLYVSEYHVAKTRYLNCDLFKYPTSKTIKTVQFDKSNSPFVFYNLISYSSKGDSARMENKFYVSEITNYPEVSMFTKVDTSICGRKLSIPEKIFKNVTPDKFYYNYTKEKYQKFSKY